MAGGRFDKNVGKVRPGNYTNFESSREEKVESAGVRGTVIIPLPKATYGPAKQFIKLTTANPDAAAATLGFSIYEDDPNRQMLLLREAFKRATTVYAYILTEGKAAQADITMTLPPYEATETSTAVSGAVAQNVGKKADLTGCTVKFSDGARKLTITLTGPVSGVKNTGLFDTVTALLAQGYSVTADGAAITGAKDFTKTSAYAAISAMTEGGADVSFPVVVAKDGAEETYTALVTYPEAGAVAQEAGDDSPTNSLKAMAKYGGSRGNTLTVTVDVNPVGGYDVLVHLNGDKVSFYEGLHTVEELLEQDDPYITFTGTGDLGEAAGTTLTGGTDEAATNYDITAFIDAWEQVKFDTVCFPFDGESAANLKQAALTKIKYMRESMGKGVQVVMPDAPGMDYEGVINVTNSVSLSGNDLSHAEACAWVAGATAGASKTESLTYVPYAGATAVVDPKSNDEAEAAIKAGEFFFSVNEDDTVVVEYDINSLTTFKKPKDKSYRKNRVIRVYDALQATIQATFPPNKFDNNPKGWDVMDGLGKAILKQFEEDGAIMNVDYDTDFLVDRETSMDDETYFNVWVQAVDSAEKLYFSIKTR